MNKEIERKYLVDKVILKSLESGIEIRQGYISNDKNSSIRVRIKDNRSGFLTLKSAYDGIARDEFEYSIPVNDASYILKKFCKNNLIIKTRYLVAYKDSCWSVDVYHFDNEGLVTAEIELESESDSVELPSWIGEEVSQIAKYGNAELARYPYKEW